MDQRRMGGGRQAREIGSLLGRLAGGLGGPMPAAAAAARLRRALGPWLSRRIADVVVNGTRWRLVLRDAQAAAEARRHLPDLLALLARDGARGVSLEITSVPGTSPASRDPAEPAREAQPVGPLTTAALSDVPDPVTRLLLERVIRRKGRPVP